jgi:hypothetical protein
LVVEPSTESERVIGADSVEHSEEPEPIAGGDLVVEPSTESEQYLGGDSVEAESAEVRADGESGKASFSVDQGIETAEVRFELREDLPGPDIQESGAESAEGSGPVLLPDIIAGSIDRSIDRASAVE